MVVPPPRRVRFLDDGQMQVVWHEGLERYTHRVDLPPAPSLTSPAFTKVEDTIVAKDFLGTSVALYSTHSEDLIFSARVRVVRGERAGLVLRTDSAGQTGWRVVVDRRQQRVEFGLLDRDAFIDARAWRPADDFTIKVIAYQESVEVYVDDRLLIHQARHRETAGQIGLLVDRAEAIFSQVHLQVFKGK